MADENTPDPLLVVEFKRDSLNLTDSPLQFIHHELGSIIERMPDSLKLEVNTAQKITVVIYTE